MRALFKAAIAAALVAFACQAAAQTTGGNVGGGGGVTQLIAGTNVTLSPISGLGVVTVTASSTASTAWSAITSGTNTTAAILCGTGCSFGVTGSGSNTATAVPVAGITGFGTGVGAWLASATSAHLLAAVSDATGTGFLVFGTGPTITLGNATGCSVASCVSGLGTGMATFLATPTAANLGATVTGAGLVAGTNVTVTGTWPNQTVNATGGGSSAFSSITGGTNTTAAMLCGTGCSFGVSGSGSNTATAVPIGGVSGLGTGIGTFLATPSATNLGAAVTGASLVAGTNITITGTWPNQTVTASGSVGAAFSSITTSTNTTATMTCGTGCAIATTGSGANNATAVPVAGVSGMGTGVGTALAVNVGTAGAVVVNGGAGGTPSSINLSNGSSYPVATSGAFGTVKPDGTTITVSAGVLTASGGSATAITPGTTTVVGATAPCVIDNSTGTTMGCAVLGSGLGLNSGTLNTVAPNRTVTTSPTVLSSDMGGQINSNVTGGGTLTIPAISSTVFTAGATATVVNYSASTEAVSTTPTVNAGGGCVSGTGIPAGASWQITSNGTTLDCSQTIGSFTIPAAYIASIARNTLALSTGLITAGSCTDNTATATGATTSSSFTYAFTADVSAATGYTSTGLLTLFPYVTSNTVHMKQCNFTASSITPAAASINWIAY